jgi:hypothetical protein
MDRADELDLSTDAVEEIIRHGERIIQGKEKVAYVKAIGEYSYKIICIEDESLIRVITITRVTRKRRTLTGSKKKKSRKESD